VRTLVTGVVATVAIVAGLAVSVAWHVASAVTRYDPARPPIE
jgi:hypothetical protein